jgi:hypothetical protein
LRDYIAQAKSDSMCAEYFVKDLRKGPQSKTLLELNLLGEKADRNVVLGLLVLSTKGVRYDKTIANAYGQFQGELNKVTKKTKKTSDAYVLKQFFAEVKQRFNENDKLSDVAKKIKFREPRQQPQRKQVTIDFSKLRAAPCMRTLDATVMRMLGNDDEATVCAVQLRSALNTPGKKNPIVSDYNKKASKLSGKVFKVDADLAPHKANKATDGKVEMSYKGVIQGVIKAAATRQKFSNVRIARILQVQGLLLEDLPTWETQDPDMAPKQTPSTKRKRSADDDFDESSQKRRRVNSALLSEIEGYDKRQLKKVEIKVTPTLLEQIRNFTGPLKKVPKPETPHQKPGDIRLDPKIAQFLKTLYSRLPRELRPHQNKNDLAIVPYQAKQQPEPVMVTVILPEGFKVVHYDAPKKDTPKTAEERGLAIVPYRGGQAGKASSDRVQTVVPSGTIINLQGVMGKVLQNKPLKPLEVRDIKDLLRTLVILPPASPGPMRALPAPREQSRTSLDDSDDWFRRPAAVGGKDSFSAARTSRPQPEPQKKRPLPAPPKRQLALPAPKRQLALPAPEENMVCLTGGLREALKEVYSGQIDPWYRKRCAGQILQRLSADLSNPHTLQGDMISLTVADKKAVSGYLKSMKEGERPANQTRLIIRKLIEGKINQQQAREYSEETAGGVIALPYKSNATPSSATRKKTLEMRRRGEKIQPTKYPGAVGRHSSQGSGLATIKEQSPDLMKRRCSASSAGGILQELYDGDLACAELAKQQWQSNAGSIGAFKKKLNETQARVVERVMNHQLTHLKRLQAGTGPQVGQLGRSDNIAFENILERFKKGTLGLKPKRTRLNVCPTSLESALSFILDTRQGNDRKECLEQMKNLVNNTGDSNTTPSEAELSLSNQLALLTDQQSRSVKLFITTLVENKRISGQQKQEALEGLLLNLSTKRTPKKQAHNRSDEDDEERDIKELLELNEKVKKCGQDYGDTLYVLRFPWVSKEMKKRCAGLALAALDGSNKTNFYEQLGKLGTRGTAKQKESVRSFVEQLKQIHSGETLIRVIDPTRV